MVHFTVNPLDELSTVYLMTRGWCHQEATSLMILYDRCDISVRLYLILQVINSDPVESK